MTALIIILVTMIILLWLIVIKDIILSYRTDRGLKELHDQVTRLATNVDARLRELFERTAANRQYMYERTCKGHDWQYIGESAATCSELRTGLEKRYEFKCGNCLGFQSYREDELPHKQLESLQELGVIDKPVKKKAKKKVKKGAKDA